MDPIDEPNPEPQTSPTPESNEHKDPDDFEEHEVVGPLSEPK